MDEGERQWSRGKSPTLTQRTGGVWRALYMVEKKPWVGGGGFKISGSDDRGGKSVLDALSVEGYK